MQTENVVGVIGGGNVGKTAFASLERTYTPVADALFSLNEAVII